MGDKDEVERIRRIRDRQISARDPTVKLNQRGQRIATQLRGGNRYGFGDALKDIKSAWIWMVVLGILGLLGGLLFMQLMPAWWSPYVAVVLTFAGGLVGRILGQLIDRGKGGWFGKD